VKTRRKDRKEGKGGERHEPSRLDSWRFSFCYGKGEAVNQARKEKKEKGEDDYLLSPSSSPFDGPCKKIRQERRGERERGKEKKKKKRKRGGRGEPT